MKNFNLYPEMAEEKKEALRTWYYFSAGLLAILFTTIVILELPQVIRLYQAKKAQKSWHADHLRVQELEKELAVQREEQANLQKLITHYKSIPDNPDYYLSLITPLLPDDIAIRSFTSKRDEPVIIRGIARSHEALDTFLQQLKSSHNQCALTEFERVQAKPDKFFFKISLPVPVNCKNKQ